MKDDNIIRSPKAGFLDAIINYFSTYGKSVDIAGRPGNTFFYREMQNKNFKHNQRGERTTSRRRKMKSNAR